MYCYSSVWEAAKEIVFFLKGIWIELETIEKTFRRKRKKTQKPYAADTPISIQWSI